MTKKETWNLYDYVEENNLLKEGLELCQDEQQREALINYTKMVCELYQPLIDNVRKVIKTDADKELFLKTILGKNNANPTS